MKKFLVYCYTNSIVKRDDTSKFINKLRRYTNVEVNDYNDHIKSQEFRLFFDFSGIYDSKNEENILIFLTDIKSLIILVYCLYHQTFSYFLYYNDSLELQYPLDALDKETIKLLCSVEEYNYKPLCINKKYIDNFIMNFKEGYLPMDQLFIDSQNNTLQNITCKDGLNDKRINEISLYNFSRVNKNNIREITKYYQLDHSFYIFEPINTLNKVYINSTGLKQTFENTHYMFPYPEHLVKEVQDMLFHKFDDLIKSYEIFFNTLRDMMKELSYYEEQGLLICLTDLAYLNQDEYPYQSILLFSFLASYTKSQEYYEEIARFTLNNKKLLAEQRYYIYQQLKTIFFQNPSLCSSATGNYLNEIYKKVYNVFEAAFHDNMHSIPKEERNKELVVIICYQFLREKHPPTHTTLERAYNLICHLNKRVLIINTHEFVTDYHAVPFYEARCANLIEDYNTISQVTYKDLSIPFCQIEEPMPSYYSMEEIINFVSDNKPYFILNIGGSSITADLCGNIVPELSMGVVFSTLPRTIGKMSIIGRQIKEAEWAHLKENGYERENIIESTFTFELNPQTECYTRADLGLPEDRFLMIVVGNRLTDDVTEEYINYISKTFSYGTHLVFVGEFPNYQELCENYPLLKEHSTSLGYVKDVLAVMDNIDLYVNPKRMGGGFSITEALYKGKPGVTIDYGDVAVAAGKEFCVGDYDELVETIIRYQADSNFYNKMSEKALQRAKILTDSGKALSDIVEKAEKNKYFF